MNSGTTRSTRCWTACLLAFALLPALASAEAAAPADTSESPTALAAMSLEDLMKVEVTSVSKKKEKRQEAAAAVFVLTQEDIRRSGAMNIPDALRLVPGISVGRIDSSQWGVASRGFNGAFANKLLVLIDGRSVYTPLDAGVFWDVQDVMLEDIERIEVVRGPGGAVWGANAVNGVINIITKKASDTQGGLLTGGAGTEEKGFGAIRYGGKAGENLYYRVYGKGFARDGGKLEGGGDGADDWALGRGGFRMDWDVDSEDKLSLHGAHYFGEVMHRDSVPSFQSPENSYRNVTTRVAGEYLVAQWDREISDDSGLTLRGYWDRAERDDPVSFDARNDILDLDFQHRFKWGERQDMIWGLGYRHGDATLRAGEIASMDHETNSDQLFSAFVQDEIMFCDDRLRLTLGSKFEHNDHTGFEVQPSVRFAWVPDDRQTWWASASRAIRIPSLIESGGRTNITAVNGTVTRLYGNPDLDSEKLIAFETGYRVQLADRFAVDLAVFYNIYDDLVTKVSRTSFTETSSSSTYAVSPETMVNTAEAETYGIEIGADWKPTSRWALRATYSYLNMNVRSHSTIGTSQDTSTATPAPTPAPDTGTPPDQQQNPGQSGGSGVGAGGDSPQHQASLQSRLTLSKKIELDATLRYVGRLPNLGVPEYITADLRLGWHPIDDLEFAIVGQNLFDTYHSEFTGTFLATEVERSVYGKITWTF